MPDDGGAAVEEREEQDQPRRDDLPPVPEPPRKWGQRLRWLGPGLVWMAAGAGGAGELLFPPRIGSLYGYTFLWALFLALVFKWAINREIGRFAASTGATLLDGFKTLDKVGDWVVWLILLPQFVVSVAAIAGLAGSAATAFILLLPGSVQLWMVVTVVSTALFLLWGKYSIFEDAATVLAIILALAGVITAISVFPALGDLAAGMVPSLPGDVDYGEVLPWLAFIMAGAAGMMWYSYWLPAKSYGAAKLAEAQGDEAVRPDELSDEGRQRLRGWLKQMTLDNTVGILIGTLIVLAFLILGAELLGPEGLVPEEQDVAQVLGRLLGDVWGNFGYWFMVVGVLIGFWNTTMTNQDGWARLFADGLAIYTRKTGWGERWKDEDFLKKVVLVVLLTLAPAALFIFRGRPVGLLQLAGVIEAIQIPILAGLVLYLNRRILPKELRPSGLSFWLTIIAALFFAAFAVFHLGRLVGLFGGGAGGGGATPTPGPGTPTPTPGA